MSSGSDPGGDIGKEWISRSEDERRERRRLLRTLQAAPCLMIDSDASSSSESEVGGDGRFVLIDNTWLEAL